MKNSKCRKMLNNLSMKKENIGRHCHESNVFRLFRFSSCRNLPLKGNLVCKKNSILHFMTSVQVINL